MVSSKILVITTCQTSSVGRDKYTSWIPLLDKVRSRNQGNYVSNRASSFIKVNPLTAIFKICPFYRPHPKDGEGNVFRLFTPGGYPPPPSQPGQNRGSLVERWGTPVQGWGTPRSGQDGGYPSPEMGYPPSKDGVPCSQVGSGGYLGLEMGYPPARSGWGTPWPRSGRGTSPVQGWGTPPSRDGVPCSQISTGGYPGPEMGYPPPARSGWGTPWPRSGRGTSLVQGWDTPCPGMGYPYPGIAKQSEHLLCSRQYTSCIHAAGLSCLN